MKLPLSNLVFQARLARLLVHRGGGGAGRVGAAAQPACAAAAPGWPSAPEQPTPPSPPKPGQAARPGAPLGPVDWIKETIQATPQFLILFAAYFSHLLIGVTVASLSVAHLTEIGVAAGVAGAMLSFESLLQTAGGVTGGLLGDRLDPEAPLRSRPGLAGDPASATP